MSNEEIVERIQKGIDVAASQEQLLEQNWKFVRWQVRRLCGHMENKADYEDYEQEGFIGLLTAAVRYDKSMGGRVSLPVPDIISRQRLSATVKTAAPVSGCQYI